MLRETTSAANDAARLDDMETAHPAELWADRAEMPPKVYAQAAIRAQLIPGLDVVLEAWARLPPATQDAVGVQAVALAFYGWLSGDPCSEPADRWLTGEAAGRCSARADRALGLINDIVGRALPELYGTGKHDPAWSRVPGIETAAVDMIWEAALPSPMQFAIALHRRTWQALQASAAFLQATGKVAERMNVTWPAEEAEDEALTDLLMLSCRDRADAKALLQHFTWYLSVRPQHPKWPLSQGDATLIAIRLQGLGLILGKTVAEAAPLPEPGALAGLIAAHRAAWSAFRAAPSWEECEREDWLSLRLAADEAACAVLETPCADRAEVAALVEHARWYAVELAAADEDRTDTLDYDAKNLAARVGDLAVYLGDSPAGGVPAGRA